MLAPQAGFHRLRSLCPRVACSPEKIDEPSPFGEAAAYSLHGMCCGCRGELLPDNRRDSGSQQLNWSQHLFVWKRRDTHLECDPREAAERFVHVEYFLRNRVRIPDQ